MEPPEVGRYLNGSTDPKFLRRVVLATEGCGVCRQRVQSGREARGMDGEHFIPDRDLDEDLLEFPSRDEEHPNRTRDTFRRRLES